jgi:non-ribosomal peptide synthetase component F
LTYDQLEAQAEKVAHHLVRLGVGPEVMVGVCMDKSKWAVVAMLATLRAGGAVVPLGRQDPVTRLEGIIHETAATVMMVDKEQIERLAGWAQHMVIVDAELLG